MTRKITGIEIHMCVQFFCGRLHFVAIDIMGHSCDLNANITIFLKCNFSAFIFFTEHAQWKHNRIQRQVLC